MQRKYFDLAQYVSKLSKTYLILRLVDFKSQQLMEQPYRSQAIIHDN